MSKKPVTEMDAARLLIKDSLQTANNPINSKCEAIGGICWIPVIKRFVFVYGVEYADKIPKEGYWTNGRYVRLVFISPVLKEQFNVYNIPEAIRFTEWLNTVSKEELIRLQQAFEKKSRTALPSLTHVAWGVIGTIATVGLAAGAALRNYRREKFLIANTAMLRAILLRFP